MFSLSDLNKVVKFAKEVLKVPEGNIQVSVQVYDDEVFFHIWVHAEDCSVIFNKWVSAPIIESKAPDGHIYGRTWEEKSLKADD